MCTFCDKKINAKKVHFYYMIKMIMKYYFIDIFRNHIYIKYTMFVTKSTIIDIIVEK